MLNARDLLAPGTRLSVRTTTGRFCSGGRERGVLDVSGESLALLFLLVLSFGEKLVDVIRVRRQPKKGAFNSATVVCALRSFSRS